MSKPSNEQIKDVTSHVTAESIALELSTGLAKYLHREPEEIMHAELWLFELSYEQVLLNLIIPATDDREKTEVICLNDGLFHKSIIIENPPMYIPWFRLMTTGGQLVTPNNFHIFLGLLLEFYQLRDEELAKKIASDQAMVRPSAPLNLEV